MKNDGFKVADGEKGSTVVTLRAAQYVCCGGEAPIGPVKSRVDKREGEETESSNTGARCLDRGANPTHCVAGLRCE